ncbi:MAG TPA: phosphoglycerate kinase [Bdellovibrionales bacterium]|nr:MAG: phosphoglycerate kinase [Bdellovibrionales bacterium GWB1_52_6]OFZ03448.1 MAG: phosphoglycerate kinase [Bdellovibrionales bacterium GWA1_52_35]OFZ41597.1 MAG: phosphoglycerate kinase [Bdellovibrionales bacterium GWC1_52_8]HAR42666.1 phosphoglycerate kinase [Bdellovibrionales bacterium]HCM41029.1 phosphoglycerate kinase [Bdellovibrionales bacterium]
MATTSTQNTGSIKSIRDLEITGKTVFIRVDFNVPTSKPDANGECHVEDDNRIVEALPTIKYAIEKGAKLILASHLGRPDGKRKPEFSLAPVARRLQVLLGQDVTLADDCVGDGIELMAKSLKNGQVLLLENLRFHAEEEENETAFAGRLARLAQVYINDAFGTAHRKHASTYGVPVLVPVKGMGFLIEKELKFLDPLLHNPKKPFYAVLGGAKVTDKIKTIESLMRSVDAFLIGGAMAHAFWAAKGITVPQGAKQPKPDDVEAARNIMREAEKKEMKILIPDDTNLGFDIGEETIKKYIDFLGSAKTIFWNGPMGWFEKPEYSAGTFDIAKAVANFSALKVVGGGDTVSAIKNSGVADKFDHLSTGGGAVLEYLEGHGLPGIEILKQTTRQLATEQKHL